MTNPLKKRIKELESKDFEFLKKKCIEEIESILKNSLEKPLEEIVFKLLEYGSKVGKIEMGKNLEDIILGDDDFLELDKDKLIEIIRKESKE
jgi:hypothetical protein